MIIFYLYWYCYCNFVFFFQITFFKNWPAPIWVTILSMKVKKVKHADLIFQLPIYCLLFQAKLEIVDKTKQTFLI